MYYDIKDRTDWFDFSNYDKIKNYDTCTDLVSSKFKDNMGGKPIEEILGPRGKMYSIKTHEGFEKKYCKRHFESRYGQRYYP